MKPIPLSEGSNWVAGRGTAPFNSTHGLNASQEKVLTSLGHDVTTQTWNLTTAVPYISYYSKNLLIHTNDKYSQHSALPIRAHFPSLASLPPSSYMTHFIILFNDPV
ncbi:unnamed protein product [Pipistrellus nathusii]|uniref:Uncharacterized protein n=1 Tax=Pipistrellus nathusii TaxID=59473 RepID=A0ABN9Z729_PIPNA